MDAHAIINKLGGYRAVADALKLSPTRVHNWTRRGIAAEFWTDVLALPAAEKEGITVAALRAAKPGKATAEASAA